MAPEVLRNEPSDEKYANNKSLNHDIDEFHEDSWVNNDIVS